MAPTRILTFAAALLLSACGSSQSGSPDASTHDAAHQVKPDAGSADTGRTRDTGSHDSAATKPHADSGSRDAGSHDSRSPDAGVPETGADAATSKCTYPAGPYGSKLGQVLDPTLQWQGYAPGASSPSTLKMTDLYDCDGSKGINALVFDTAAQWCPNCQIEAESLPGWMSSTAPNAGDWTALGVQWVTLVVQDNNDHPATITTAEQWRNEFSLTSVWVAADPTASFTTNAIPYAVLVNPRTMMVVVDMDYDAYDASVAGDAGSLEAPDPKVAGLARQNQRDQ